MARGPAQCLGPVRGDQLAGGDRADRSAGAAARLETSERPARLLEECSRVLGPGGRAIFIVPNRAGLWARSDLTPFGFGRPYTLRQLEGQLREHEFTIERHTAALYRLPSHKRFWLKTGAMFERMGDRLPAMLAGGVFMVEVSKQTHPQKGHMIRPRTPNPIRVLEGLSNPLTEPA